MTARDADYVAVIRRALFDYLDGNVNWLGAIDGDWDPYEHMAEYIDHRLRIAHIDGSNASVSSSDET
jgi:hypothetical protein